jgi:hypothetical protein
MKIYFMAIPIKHNHFSKLLVGMTVLCMICIYSCNDTSSKDEKKDTVAAPKDTSMKMNSDTTKTDTTGRGGQPSPGGH